MEERGAVMTMDFDDYVYNFQSFSERIFMTYDFGICMTSMDKYRNFYNSELFDKDVENQTFTVNIKQLRRNNDAGMAKLVERAEKMESYFPNHKMTFYPSTFLNPIKPISM